MGNWLSTEPGLSSVDTVQIPSGQRDDNRRGGEETEGKGRNRTAVEGYTVRIRKFIQHTNQTGKMPYYISSSRKVDLSGLIVNSKDAGLRINRLLIPTGLYQMVLLGCMTACGQAKPLGI